jgi:subtilisin family serine protease
VLMKDKAKTVLYVHGIGNKPTEDVLKCQWDRALFGFELGERSRLAYWVNRAFYPNPSPVTCQSGDKTRVGAQSGDIEIKSVALQTTEAALEAEIKLLAKNAEERRFLERVKNEVLASENVGSENVRTAGIEAKVLPLPAPLRKWLTQTITRAWLRDVHEFFYVQERREAMRNSVLERLTVGGGPFVIIGHSQGSMIAYDVLVDLASKEANVPLFLTMGSPLGLKEVQDQFRRFRKVKGLKVPSCVGQWVNVADPLDPVSLDKTLRTEFIPKKSISDETVWNNDSPRDPHSATGYLTHDTVRGAVQQAVDIGLFQPVSSFVIARDLVRDIESEGLRRHPVLIEIKAPTDVSLPDLGSHKEKIASWLRTTSGASENDLRIEELRRYLAADLTRQEIEMLASNFKEQGLEVHRLWRNSEKRALITTSIDVIQVRPAHSGYGADGRDIRWAVLDSGIAAEHPHFSRYDNIAAEFDCTKPGPLKKTDKASTRGDAPDHNGHGTHVAGIIAGTFAIEAKNKPVQNLSGMAPAAKLLIYKVLSNAGTGRDAWIIKALDHIASVNADSAQPVIHGVNLSLGGSYDPSVFGCGHTPLCQELRRLWNQGVIVVVAAGNEGFAVLQGAHGDIDANMDLSIGDPANLEEAISVGSINKTNPHTYGISYFSSRGPTADGRQKPDLVAPGERIVSCRHDFVKNGRTEKDLYVEMSGTSMAAPHVSGMLASYLSSRREFIGFPTKVKQIMLENCTDLKRDPMHQGAGLPNLVKMLMNT